MSENDLTRRRAIAMAAAGAVVTASTHATAAKESRMYGLIGKMNAVRGKRDELISLLLEGVGDMPGCLSYIVAEDVSDPDAVWITEVWDTEESHRSSLGLPAVQRAITTARPFIAGFEHGAPTRPVGGFGLDRAT